ncbi:TPA: hypothetical protein ACH3X1_001145 [Trebouxia sp. C0004]
MYHRGDDAWGATSNVGFNADHALSKEATERLDADDDLGLDAGEVGNRYIKA